MRAPIQEDVEGFTQHCHRAAVGPTDTRWAPQLCKIQFEVTQDPFLSIFSLKQRLEGNLPEKKNTCQTQLRGVRGPGNAAVE